MTNNVLEKIKYIFKKRFIRIYKIFIYSLKYQNYIIKKDKIDELCYHFAKNIKGANIEKLQNAMLKKDKYWLSLFNRDIKNTDKELLLNNN